MNEATRKILSEKKLGEKHPKYMGQFITPWGQFPSANQAAAEISKLEEVKKYIKGSAKKLTAKQVIERCTSWEWKERGYSFIAKEDIL